MSRARKLLAIATLTMCVTVAATAALAIDPITWRTIDCGGISFSTTGNLRLGATIGQADAGQLTGGAFTLRGGFWTGGQSGTLDVEDGTVTPRVFRFYPTHPNPVRTQSRVSFDLPRSSRVALAVYDVTGRAMRRWDFGVLPAGRQERAWNAADGAGRALPNGVYFLRLETERERAVHRIVVLR